jgi:FkbM family methyltransferase
VTPRMPTLRRMRPLATRLTQRAQMRAWRAGFVVERDPWKFRVVHALHERGITDVLDIGANAGQFVDILRQGKVAGRIVSVEPLREPFDELAARAASDPRWEVERAAVSSEPGTITVNVSSNSVSSSVLPMLDRHTEAAPGSVYVATEEVAATTVDDLVARHQLDPARTMLKIDVQGYEQAVLDGAHATLDRFAAVRTELSLVALYEGQALLADMVQRLERHGLDLWVHEPGFNDPVSRRQMQFDGTFFRRQ